MPRYIDADKLRAYFTSRPPDWYHTQIIVSVINDVPAADVWENRYGMWLHTDYGYSRCSECGYVVDEQNDLTPYCPWCGANMEPDPEEES